LETTRATPPTRFNKVIGMITEKELDRILNEWAIHGSSERWSIKAMFLRDNANGAAEEDFIKFLESKFGEKNNPNSNKS
jgi:hypothetical protein